jgi:pimeloyl-ACP methyl ester carboxylesterase
MMAGPTVSRRAFMKSAAALAAMALPALRTRAASGPMRRVSTDVLDVAYLTAGPEDGRPVVLAHDFGYGVESFSRAAPLLAAAGLRVLAPQLRGHGGTRFHDPATPRSGQQAALGKDLIDFIDALHIPEAVFAGFGWGAHAAASAARVRPTRCIGLVLSGIGRIDEAGPRERYLYASDAGRRELDVRRRQLARETWRRLSPQAPFDAALFAQVAPALDNPDYVPVLAHAWLSRHAPLDPLAAPDPRYAALEKKFAQPADTAVAALTLAGAGHHLPFETPRAFADAVLDLVHAGKWRT